MYEVFQIAISFFRFALLANAITQGALFVDNIKVQRDSFAHVYCALSTAAFAWSMGWI